MNRREIGIYVHIPFCVRKCAYCDFLSFPAAQKLQHTYFQKLREEIASFDCAQDHEAVSVYFGGGTPSLPDPEEIIQTLELIRTVFIVSEDAEITIECNPGTMDKGRLSAYRDAGINRLSIGLQSADDSLLKTLGRIHTREVFLREYLEAREAGFDNVSVDLMYGLPGQTLRSWTETLDLVKELSPEHISAYSLIVEEGTPFWSRYHEDDMAKRRGEKPLFLPDEEEEDRMLEVLRDSLRDIGMYRYEISNYALPGRESRHNTGYWKRREYAGFGLGASGQIGQIRYRNQSDMDLYLAAGRQRPADNEQAGDGMQPADNRPAADKNQSTGRKQPVYSGQAGDRMQSAEEGASDSFREEVTVLTREDEISETMILGLRMTEGVNLARFEECFHERAEDLFSEQIEKFRQAGLLELSKGHLYLTDRGLDVSNLVMCEFL